MRPYFTLIGLIVFSIKLVKSKSDKTVNIAITEAQEKTSHPTG